MRLIHPPIAHQTLEHRSSRLPRRVIHVKRGAARAIGCETDPRPTSNAQLTPEVLLPFLQGATDDNVRPELGNVELGGFGSGQAAGDIGQGGGRGDKVGRAVCEGDGGLVGAFRCRGRA